jgi:hypothetical protein
MAKAAGKRLLPGPTATAPVLDPTCGGAGRVTAGSTRTPDCLQRALVPRSRFRQQVSASVVAPRKLGVSYWVKVPVG